MEKRAKPSFTNKLMRAFWGLVRISLFRFTPVFFHGWRCWVLRAFGAKIGRSVQIYPSAEIWAPWNLTIEDGVTVGGRVRIYNVDKVLLQSGSITSQWAYLCTASHDYNSSNFELMTAPIIVGPEAWVAAEAFIGPGIHIGAGAVVLARAVVKDSVGAKEIVGGNPAMVVGQRNEQGRNKL